MALPQGAASIEDRGYHRYLGPRLGVSYAVLTMLLDGAKRSMGIRRPFRDKILPWLLLASCYGPVTFIIAARIVLPVPNESLLPSRTLYAGFFSLITLPLIL